MQKVVLKLSIHDGKDQQKALKAVSSITGIDSLSVDMKEGKLTVIGDVDPIEVVGKLRKQWQANIVTVGPAKEEKKDGKNEGGDGKKKEDGGGDKNKNKTPEPIVYYHNYHPYHYPTYYCVQSYEENPNACTIC